MPEQPTSSRFPLPLDLVERHMSAFGGFSDTRLDMVARSNKPEQPNDVTPLGHMWDFNEDPLFTSLLWFANPADRPYKNESVLPPMRAYRAAACLGDILMRAREDELAAQGIELEPVQLDPLRHYLILPEDTKGDAAGRYRGERFFHDLTDTYANTAVQHGYFAQDDAVGAMHALRDVWQRTDMGYLFPTAEDPSSFFGEICRGMFQLMRLYKLGEQEAAVAPWTDTGYDPAKHFHTDDDRGLVQRNPYSHKMRRISTTLDILSDEDAPDQAEGWFGTVPHAASVVAVRTCLTGYIPVAGQPDMIEPVGFRRSIREYTLKSEDVLIVRGDDESSRLFRHPFHSSVLAEAGYATAQALCRDGEVTMLDSPMFPPNDSFYAAIDEALTGTSPLYKIGVDKIKGTAA
jgi:hypothetical protein